jgi:hypothetical protein
VKEEDCRLFLRGKNFAFFCTKLLLMLDDDAPPLPPSNPKKKRLRLHTLRFPGKDTKRTPNINDAQRKEKNNKTKEQKI